MQYHISLAIEPVERVTNHVFDRLKLKTRIGKQFSDSCDGGLVRNVRQHGDTVLENHGGQNSATLSIDVHTRELGKFGRHDALDAVRQCG